MENVTEAQYLSMLLISISSFVLGILPTAFSLRMSRFQPFFLSLILCMGAGVLLATSLVHLLTEVQVVLQLSAQLYFCAGFLVLYTLDEVSHYFLRFRKPQTNSVVPERNLNYSSTTVSENSPLLESSKEKNLEHLLSEKNFECSHSHYSARSNEESRKIECRRQSLSKTSISPDSNDQAQPALEEPSWSHNSAAETGLLIALLIHSILEGVSIGVQTKVSQVVVILGAIAFHKAVLSFCLGLELHYNGFKFCQLLASIFLFSIGSPFGIFLGMTVTSLEHGIFGIDFELQAIAAGSLLYVAAFEVLPRERFKWQCKNDQKAAGILQLIFMLLGFTCITAFHFLVDPINCDGNKSSNSTKKFS